jgi:hypothetical protein
MAETRHREGSKALLSYNFSKEPELANSLDPGSDATGNMRYVLNEIYESPDGIADHWQQAQASWGDFGAMVKMIASCNPQSSTRARSPPRSGSPQHWSKRRSSLQIER